MRSSNSPTTHAEGAFAAVQHAEGPSPLVRTPLPPSNASCARCGAPAANRRGARYCSPACRFADVRERRAAARSDLLAALDQLTEVTHRVENALRVLGLNPRKPRSRRKEAP
jgi:hypothetical protein